ncbi:uncharacterized protein LOC143489201 [Brachyhypopomus gauderio]|uniref:uncharacterized protein LOC143489201 n=1 Tax=Brachyhypopomus gauderio TaxID=698409 RepID=UPI004042169D
MALKRKYCIIEKKCKCLVNNGKEEVKDQEIQRLVQTLKKKDELLDQMQHEQHSLKEKVKELANDLMQQDLVYRNTVSTLETERAAATRLTAENQALSSKLVEFQQVTDYMSTKLQALETDLSIQTSTVIDLSEELQKAKALLRDGEEERTQQSSTISSLKLEVGELQQKLHTLSRESDCDFQRNIKAIMTTLHEKSRKIEALETELSRTRKEMEKVLEEERFCPPTNPRNQRGKTRARHHSKTPVAETLRSPLRRRRTAPPKQQAQHHRRPQGIQMESEVRHRRLQGCKEETTTLSWSIDTTTIIRSASGFPTINHFLNK